MIDSIYASSSTLTRLSRHSFHAASRRKAEFLANLQAILVRSRFTMLTTHTSSARAPGPSEADADASDPSPSSPDTSRAPTPEPTTPAP